QGLGLHQGAHALLEEERIALRAFDEYVLERGEIRIVAEEIDEEVSCALHGQRIDAQLPIARLAAPSVAVLGSVARDQEEARGGQAVDEAVEKRLRLAVDPVKSLEHEEERLRLALAQEEVSHAFQGSLAPAGGIKTLPGRVHYGRSKERQESGQRGLELGIEGKHARANFVAHRLAVVA